MITYEELQQWIDEQKKFACNSEFSIIFKQGYMQALISIEIKMDEVKKYDDSTR